MNQIIAEELRSTGLFKETAFAASFALGLAGGVLYGMTSTDVYGDATLKVTLVRKSTGENLIDKDYVTHVEEKSGKLNCDTAETRSRMAGRAVKAVMEQFKADLAPVVQSLEATQAALPEPGDTSRL